MKTNTIQNSMAGVGGLSQCNAINDLSLANAPFCPTAEPCAPDHLANLKSGDSDANIIFQADGGKLPETASDAGKPIALDVPIGANVAKPKLKVLDLFSGIGGFSLGLERTNGFETIAFCEIEPFPRKVLAKHWPEVPIYDDVRTLTADRLAADGIAVDVICGGFPCQDISTAGRGAGLAGERSGLWSEIARLVGELRPAYVIVENVSALLGRGLGTVLGDLTEIGYDAEWHCIPASHVGAPHRRDRIWIMAYPRHQGILQRGQYVNGGRQGSDLRRICGDVLSRREQEEVLADADSQGLQGRAQAGNAGSQRQGSQQLIIGRIDREWATWPVEPELGRVANGIPDRSHRLKGLGNAVVPKIPEFIGNAILGATP